MTHAATAADGSGTWAPTWALTASSLSADVGVIAITNTRDLSHSA
jgi:hypothetical protein